MKNLSQVSLMFDHTNDNINTNLVEQRRLKGSLDEESLHPKEDPMWALSHSLDREELRAIANSGAEIHQFLGSGQFTSTFRHRKCQDAIDWHNSDNQVHRDIDPNVKDDETEEQTEEETDIEQSVPSKRKLDDIEQVTGSEVDKEKTKPSKRRQIQNESASFDAKDNGDDDLEDEGVIVRARKSIPQGKRSRKAVFSPERMRFTGD